jgi:soluble cytochrome b562
MTVSGISSSTVNSYQTNDLQKFRQQFMQLAQSLQSGDLSGAQQAYSALSQLQGNSQPQSNANDPFSQALSKIGQALQSGDLKSAQQALSALLQQTKARHHHHHHQASSDGKDTSATNGSVSNDNASSVPSTSSGNSVNVTV